MGHHAGHSAGPECSFHLPGKWLHKQEAQNMVFHILHEVQLFVIVTLGEKMANRFRQYSHLTLCITLQSPCSCGTT